MQVSYLTSALVLLGAVVALPLASDGISHQEVERSYVQTLHARNQSGVLDELLNTTPTTTKPKDEDELRLRLSLIWGVNGTGIDFYAGVKSQITADLGFPDGISTADFVAPTTAAGSTNNNNPKNPSPSVYPKKSSADAPYSLSESDLRSVIQIPSSFTYGARPPVILVPGTGTYGGEVFASNLLKVLPGSSYADPVWLNIPGALLADAQVNAEYVAYAINYISGISGNKNVSLITWSQGGLDAQWALTFWPSTRKVVSDLVAVSPDFHGTVLAPVLCLATNPTTGAGLNPCPPSVVQQEYTSKFVTNLRLKGGADAYVPTTTIYSGFFDEIVEPQQGIAASAFIRDGRKVGVTNVEAQSACLGKVGAGFYGHAGMLFHPLTVALVTDALSHPGPGKLDRLDLSSTCSKYVAPGLSLDNAIATSGQIVSAAIRLLTYFPRLVIEPELKQYAI